MVTPPGTPSGEIRRTEPLVRAAACCAALALVCWLAACALAQATSARTAYTAILPPDNPQYALTVGRNLPSGCSGASDYSRACIDESLGMLNAGRRSEGLGPLMLPANWRQLTVARQLFVLTDLERTARGLEPEAGLSPALSSAAEAGAVAGSDPVTGASDFGSLWAGGQPNAVVVMADWIYEDGLFGDGSSQNLYCTPTSHSACWAHRDLLLQHGPAPACDSRCLVGAGYSPSGNRAAPTGYGRDSYAEIFASGGGARPMSFAWAAELSQLPACERAGDSCSWAGSPLLTAAGLRRAGGGPGSGPSASVPSAGQSFASAPSASPPSASPQSASPPLGVHVQSLVGAGGRVSLAIRVGARLVSGATHAVRPLRVSAVARMGMHTVRLRVRRLARDLFTATGRLTAGSWIVTLRYSVARTRRSGRLARMAVSIPRTG
jgi:hypothetical protein